MVPFEDAFTPHAGQSHAKPRGKEDEGPEEGECVDYISDEVLYRLANNPSVAASFTGSKSEAEKNEQESNEPEEGDKSRNITNHHQDMENSKPQIPFSDKFWFAMCLLYNLVWLAFVMTGAWWAWFNRG